MGRHLSRVDLHASRYHHANFLRATQSRPPTPGLPAITRSLPKLGAVTFAVIFDSGGLGHVGIQILTAISGATVIALDVSNDQLRLATEDEADHVLVNDVFAARKIREITGGCGANAIFGFVSSDPTMALTQNVVALTAVLTIIGIGRGTMTLRFGAIACHAAVRVPYWGLRSEPIEVLELARTGKISVEIQTNSLDDGPRAYADLAASSIRGRALIVP